MEVPDKIEEYIIVIGILFTILQDNVEEDKYSNGSMDSFVLWNRFPISLNIPYPFNAIIIVYIDNINGIKLYGALFNVALIYLFFLAISH